MNEPLSEIYKRHCTVGDVGHGDKGGLHSYIDQYERLLSPYRNGCTLMEIGVALGLSLDMWLEYMPTSTIIGVDISISFDTNRFKGTKVILIQDDATKPIFLDNIRDYTFDVVIDDGSHWIDAQTFTFKIVSPKMAKGGIYIIEDILSLDTCRKQLEELHPNCEIIDMRKNKGRFDDVLAVYRF